MSTILHTAAGRDNEQAVSTTGTLSHTKLQSIQSNIPTFGFYRTSAHNACTADLYQVPKPQVLQVQVPDLQVRVQVQVPRSEVQVQVPNLQVRVQVPRSEVQVQVPDLQVRVQVQVPRSEVQVQVPRSQVQVPITPDQVHAKYWSTDSGW